MTYALRFVNKITQRNPLVTCILVALVTLAVDFITGREIRFPLVYLLPIGIAGLANRLGQSPERRCKMVQLDSANFFLV